MKFNFRIEHALDATLDRARRRSCGRTYGLILWYWNARGVTWRLFLSRSPRPPRYQLCGDYRLGVGRRAFLLQFLRGFLALTFGAPVGEAVECRVGERE